MKLSNEELKDLIGRLKTIIKDVDEKHEAGFVFDMCHCGECSYGATYGDAKELYGSNNKLGFMVESLSVDEYTTDLTKLQALVVSLFTTKYGYELTKEEWLEVANKVLNKLKRKLEKRINKEETNNV